MNVGFLIVTIYVESKKLFHLFLLFSMFIMETPLVMSLNLSKDQVLAMCVCAGKVTVVMVVCPDLLGYGMELAH
jgi:hypothetical protein